MVKLREHFHIRIISLLFIFFTFSSCEKVDNRWSKIEYETRIAIEVKKIKLERGGIILNDKYSIHQLSSLIYKDSFPNWIKDRNGKGVYFNKAKEEYVHKPILSDIYPNYKLIKEENDSTFLVVKHEDTLQFTLKIPDLENDMPIKEFLQKLFKSDE